MLPTSGVIGLFTGPHHTFFSDPSSLTIRLSRGDRPVFAPEYAVIAPVDVMAEPVSKTRASSYKAATEGLAISKTVSDLLARGAMGDIQLTRDHSRYVPSRGVLPRFRCAPSVAWAKMVVSRYPSLLELSAGRDHSLYTTWMQACLVYSVWNHFGQ